MTNETIEPSTAGGRSREDDPFDITRKLDALRGIPGIMVQATIAQAKGEIIRLRTELRSRLPLASSVEPTGGVVNQSLAELLIDRLEKAWPEVVAQDDVISNICRNFIPAAPPSPRSDDGSGLTPSEHGASAALRAAVLEEREACAKIADTCDDRETACDDDQKWIAECIASAIRSRLQPAAAIEGASPEAVKPTPSIEVGEAIEWIAREMVEMSFRGRHAKPLDDIIALLLSLDAERGRIREALKDLLKACNDRDDEPETVALVAFYFACKEQASSALGGV